MFTISGVFLSNEYSDTGCFNGFASLGKWLTMPSESGPSMKHILSRTRRLFGLSSSELRWTISARRAVAILMSLNDHFKFPKEYHSTAA